MVTDEAKEALAAKGFDPAFGARPLKRLIQREIVTVWRSPCWKVAIRGRALSISNPICRCPHRNHGDKLWTTRRVGETAEQMPGAATRTFVLR